MDPLHSGPVPPEGTQSTSTQGDFVLRRRINAELLEIRNALRESNLRERNVGPVANLLAEWYEASYGFLREPRGKEVMPDLKDVINRFVNQLENLLADPFNVQNPYPPQLFGELPPLIVQFIIAKVTNPDSLFYSKTIHAAKPAPAPAPAIPSDFEEQLRKIEMLRKQRLKEDEEQLPGVQSMLGNLRKIQENQKKDFARYGEQFNEAVKPIVDGIHKLAVDIPEQQEIIKSSIQRHKKQVQELQKDLEKLEVDRRAVKKGIEEQRKADLEVKVAINRLEQSIAQAKENQANDLLLAGGLMLVSAALTWGLSQFYYGVSVSLMQCSKTFVGIGVTLGAAGASRSNKGANTGNVGGPSQNKR